MTDEAVKEQNAAPARECRHAWYDPKTNSGHLCGVKGAHTEHVCKTCQATPPK